MFKNLQEFFLSLIKSFFLTQFNYDQVCKWLDMILNSFLVDDSNSTDSLFLDYS